MPTSGETFETLYEFAQRYYENNINVFRKGYDSTALLRKTMQEIRHEELWNDFEQWNKKARLL